MGPVQPNLKRQPQLRTGHAQCAQYENGHTQWLHKSKDAEMCASNPHRDDRNANQDGQA